MISEDLDEIVTLTDRVLVMYEGSVIGEVDPRTTTLETLGLMMAGVPVGSDGHAEEQAPPVTSPLGE